MGDNNKVLAVSYGTFSCRLEGFDDSVETMKTVVSYFHDLAGHDRFMDLEPQAPDMDTLARLTEEQTGIQVDAEDDSGRISLRVKKPDAAEANAPGAKVSLRIPKPQLTEEPPVASVEDDDTDLVAEDINAFDNDDLANDLADEDALNDDLLADEDTLDDLAALDGDDVDEEEDEAIEEEVVAEDEEAEMEDIDALADQEDAPASLSPLYDDAPADDSVAAKLQRIRAVVGRVRPPSDAEGYDEDTSDAPGSASDEMPLTDMSAKDDEAESIVDDFDFAEDDSEEAPLVLSEDDIEEDDKAPDEEASDAVAEEVEAVVASEEDDDADDMLEDADTTAAADDDTDLDEEDDSSDLEEDDDEFARNLHEEVAEVEREIALRRQNRSKRDNLPDNDDDAMKRIMSQTDERLNEPEGRRHRDAFAQLKAAVAATEAARQLGDNIGDEDPKDAFRQDLDDAVREPDEDDVEEEETAQEDDTSAPLKLVPAQRVDEDAPAAEQLDKTAQRLREIAAVKDVGTSTDGGFEEFAAQQGATELVDLLEAAAAYIAFVEGDDDFSRPQVMKKVQLASNDSFSREDGLRSFGRLLRQSKIIKLNNGRFQVSEDTRFRPDDKAAQG